MNFKQFMIQKLSLFFMLTTLITVAVCVVGSVFDPHAQLTYKELLTPLYYAFCCVLPTLVTYSKRELTSKEFFIRMVLELLMIEAVMLYFAFSSPAIDTSRASVVLIIALSVLLIYLIARLFSWFRDSSEAKQMNVDLCQFQERHDH